jgi:hypothetical protein
VDCVKYARTNFPTRVAEAASFDGPAIRRGLKKMRIQAFLTAVAFNLKLLATAVAALLVPLLALTRWPIDCSR